MTAIVKADENGFSPAFKVSHIDLYRISWIFKDQQWRRIKYLKKFVVSVNTEILTVVYNFG